MVAMNRNGKHLFREIEDYEILKKYDSMSPCEFVTNLMGVGEERGIAYRYLFELCDDNDRIEKILECAEKNGLMDSSDLENL